MARIENARDSSNQSIQRRWPRLRFGLRGLLALTAIIGAFLGYCKHEAARFERNYATTKKIFGICVVDATTWGKVVGLLMAPDHAAYGEVTEIVAIQLESLRLPHTADDERLFAVEDGRELRSLPCLSSPRFRYRNFAPGSLPLLGECRAITSLHFERCSLHGDSLEWLRDLPLLTEVSFVECDVTNAGIESLAACLRVTKVRIAYCDVDQNVFEILARAPALNDIGVYGDKISLPAEQQPERLRQLRKSRKGVL